MPEERSSGIFVCMKDKFWNQTNIVMHKRFSYSHPLCTYPPKSTEDTSENVSVYPHVDDSNVRVLMSLSVDNFLLRNTDKAGFCLSTFSAAEWKAATPGRIAGS